MFPTWSREANVYSQGCKWGRASIVGGGGRGTTPRVSTPSSNSRSSGVIDLDQGQARSLMATEESHTGNNHSAGSKIRYSLAVWFNPGTMCRTSVVGNTLVRRVSMPRFPSTLPLHPIGRDAGDKGTKPGEFRGEGDGKGPESGDTMLPTKRTEDGSNHPELRTIIEAVFVRIRD